MKKALICVQGINSKQGYLYSEVVNTDWLAGRYDFIVEAQTDRIFEEHAKKGSISTSIIKAITLGQWDRLGDIWYFFKNDLAREQVSKLVGRKITILKDQGYEVDIIAHSLGNLITMCANDGDKELGVNNFYSLANPLFIKIRGLRKGWFGLPGTLPYVALHREKFHCNQAWALWSNSDLVAGKYDSDSHDLIDSISRQTAVIKEMGNIGHKTKNYLDFLKTIIG